MKRTFVIIMSLILVVGLPACGQDAESTGELEQQIEESEIENRESEQQGEEETENDESEQQGEESETENDESEQQGDESEELIENTETSGKCGENIIWYYKNEVLYITGTGEMEDYEDIGYMSDLDGWYYIEEVTTPWYWRNLYEKIDEIIIDEGVTSIGDWSFYGCSSLREITIPDSVTVIGECAFRECSGLTEITIPD